MSDGLQSRADFRKIMGYGGMVLWSNLCTVIFLSHFYRFLYLYLPTNLLLFRLLFHSYPDISLIFSFASFKTRIKLQIVPF